MMKKISLLFSLAVLTMLYAFSTNAGFLVEEQPYIEDTKTKIIDHVVYKLIEPLEGEKYYMVYDWFDTEKASETVKEINIVPEIDGVKVTRIGRGMDEAEGLEYCRNKNYSVKKITIPDTVVYIRDFFFSVLDGVEELTLPASINSIYSNGIYDDGLSMTFAGMENLRKVTVLGELESLGGFKNCEKLETVMIKGSVNEITSGAFENCTSLRNIQIPKTVKKIGDRAFANTAITSVTLPVDVMLGHYHGNVFENCRKLTKVVITGGKNDWIGIYNETFKNCTALKTVTFPKAMKGITVYDGAFYNCKSLQKLVFPQSCTDKVRIEKNAFRNCTSLQSVKFPRTCKELKIGNDSFRNCTSLKSINLPKKCAPISIGYRAFRNCRNLTKIYNAANIQKVYGGAFRDCVSLPSITYSEKISMIGKNAYYGCTNLKKVTVNSTKNAPKIYKNAFYKTNDGIRFVVKNNGVAAQWKTQLKNSGLKNIKVV